MSLRVLVLAPHPFYVERGTPMAELALVEALCGAGHEVDVLAYPEGRDPGVPGCRVLRVPRIPGVSDVPPGLSWKKVAYDVLFAGSVTRRATRRRYDLVHAVEESVFLAWLLDRFVDLPFVWDMDSALVEEVLTSLPAARPLGDLLRRLEGRVARRATGVLAMCPALAERARAAGAAEPVGVAEDATLLDRPAESWPRPSDLADVPPGGVIMYVGNLAPYQGVELLLAAFERLAAEREDVELVVVGGAGEALARLRERVAASGYGKRAHLLGRRPLEELGAYLGAADVLVSPRLYGENTPMKLYSYLDSGRPVVATRIPAHTQVVDRRTAALAEPDPAALSEAIGGLLDDPERRDRLADRARRLVREQYSPAARRRKILGFYDRLERTLVEE